MRSGANGCAVTETVWQQVGGSATFEKIVREFYSRVQQDSLLAPMYPEADWEGAIWRLQTFLEQYWGGPTTYSENRGHPRLRMRHAPFAITAEARDRWLTHMHAALDAARLPPLHDAAIRDYVTRAAHALLNTPG
ncbi:MAG: globin [Microbacteriaceae bacterium]|nr:globin [Microbacteriaceae bacterium]